MTITTMANKVKHVLGSRRDELIERREQLQAQRVGEAAKKQRALEAARAEVDRLDEPRRRLERLEAEAASATLTEERAIAEVEAELRTHKPRELERFEALVERLSAKARTLDPVQPVVVTNEILEESRITNLPAIEKQNAVGPLLARLRVEIRDSLWRLDDEALKARIGALRAEVETALAGTVLESEI